MEIKPIKELQERENDTMADKLVADSKIDTLVKELAENKAKKTAADRREKYLIYTLKLLREEVGEFS